jgi:hypothetical protein
MVDVYKVFKQFKKMYEDKTSLIDDFVFEQFSPIFSSSNENLVSLYNCLNLDGDSILTVLAGGDQYFEALMRGFKNITTFDINIFSYYYLFYRIITIFDNPYETGSNIYSHGLMPYEEFRTFRDLIPEEVFEFWSLAYSKILGFNLRNVCYGNPAEREDLVSYRRSKEDYMFLKKILLSVNLKEIPFLNCNIAELSTNINGMMFDNINLSNIYDYKYEWSKNEKECNRVILSILKHLNKEGVAILNSMRETNLDKRTLGKNIKIIQKAPYIVKRIS